MAVNAEKHEDQYSAAPSDLSLRLLVLDTSHFSELAGFCQSQKTRARAREFEARLLEQGYILLLSFHHFDELIQHGDDALVDARIEFLAGLSHVAWVRDYREALGLGTVVDILVAEAEAQLSSPQCLFFRFGMPLRREYFSSAAGGKP